ncbi:hypothetical protein LHYA1_G002128 [Lachnellula hyalina]|uniref:CFEM domain-containing protein n=1 Tax=Lachnellula hyalina TaxID=1316788 RepID=A0A8H8R574_9HELO|nr:uncharacterized protein LHYA1_G002128 [Lachnellula hyalina]TVY28817.1 hypothetical protein LHYA1_G002128 [Lachnellula hyalina]
MRLLRVLCSLVVISSTVGQIDAPAPGCAISCWENTKYVSKCLNDIGCLCGESGYQNSVYQCIYSQCDTVHFGSALHHTIAQCGTGNQIIFGIPPVPDNVLLQRREEEYLAGAKSLGPPGSSSLYRTESADGSSFPTQSALFPLQSAGGYSPQATASPYFPLNAATLPAIATSTEPAAIAVSRTPAPLLFTGTAHRHGARIPLLSTLAALYFVL